MSSWPACDETPALRQDTLEILFRLNHLTKMKLCKFSLCGFLSLSRSYRFSSIDTPAILMFTSSTVSPIMFSNRTLYLVLHLFTYFRNAEAVLDV